MPGYDRHFGLAEALGFELVPIATDAKGPDMDQVASLVADDPTVKGIWIVPSQLQPDRRLHLGAPHPSS